MDAELLLCDIGNTTVKIGFANRNRVLASYTLPDIREETADSLGLELLSFLNHAQIAPDALKGCVVSSVVPAAEPIFTEAATRYISCPILFAPRDLPVPLENSYSRPNEVGADRLVGAYAARMLYPDPPSLIVVDFGTAATFDCVSGQSYLGGLIFPGPGTAVAALGRHTAKLPSVSLDIQAMELTPGRDTVTSIQHGIVFGYVCVVEGLCGRLKKQLNGPVKVLATGGFASSIARLTPVFDAILPGLLLEGLRRLYYDEKGGNY